VNLYVDYTSKALRYGPCVTRSHSFTYHPHTTIPLHAGRRYRCPVAAPTHEGIARLSWLGWLITSGDKCPALEIESGHSHLFQCKLGSTSVNVGRNQCATATPDHHRHQTAIWLIQWNL